MHGRKVFFVATYCLIGLSVFMQFGCATAVKGISSVSDKGSIEKIKEAIMETDRQFSELSVKEGVLTAFTMFMTDESVMFRNLNPPFEGRQAIEKILEKTPKGTLSWDPYFVDVAASGDLGYTLGKYTFTSVNSEGDQNVSTGFYVTVWKLQNDGTWKFVFDGGVSGPHKSEEE